MGKARKIPRHSPIKKIFCAKATNVLKVALSRLSKLKYCDNYISFLLFFIVDNNNYNNGNKNISNIFKIKAVFFETFKFYAYSNLNMVPYGKFNMERTFFGSL